MRSNFFQKSCHSASARVGHNLFKKTRKTNNLWHASLTENVFSYHFFKKYYLQKLTPKLLQNIFSNYKDNILSKSLRVKALDMQPVILLKTSVNPITAIFQKNFEWLLQSKKNVTATFPHNIRSSRQETIFNSHMIQLFGNIWENYQHKICRRVLFY